MSGLVRCKVCGYVMTEGKFDECPACGVPSKMFEPFEDKVPKGRRWFLEKHIHPIIVHVPQGLGFLLLVLSFVYTLLVHLTIQSDFSEILLHSIQVMSVILPLTVFGGFFSGLVDGKVRYKKLNTILLRRKMIVGSLFILLSIGMGIIAFQQEFAYSLSSEILYLAMSLGAFLCSAFLGIWGSSLNEGIMPGPFPPKKAK